MNELATIPGTLVALASTDDVYRAFLERYKPNTMEGYAADLADFARFIGVASAGIAVETLLAMGHGNANRLALAYRAHLAERGLASATIARRITALRSMVTLAGDLGRVNWSLSVKSPKVKKFVDTVGPGLDGYRKMRETVQTSETMPGKRDFALMLLMHDSALRRGECTGLDLCHVDVAGSRVSIVGKGSTEREWITISPQAKAALVDWISVRGESAGPLFFRLDRAAPGVGRLTGDSVNRMVGRTGRKAGLTRRTKAHGLRHQGITRALDLTNGNIRAAQKLGRHVNVQTTMTYDDNRQDLAGQLACMLGNDSE